MVSNLDRSEDEVNFLFRSLPWNIVFGPGTVEQLPERLDALGYKRPLLLTTPGQVQRGERVAAMLSPREAALFANAKTHTPLPTVLQALETAEKLGSDCTIAIGGGSTIGLGKGLALKAGLPNIAIPTTYSGSEMTNIWGYSDGAKKEIGRSDAVVPKLTIYDPELTLDLPLEISGPSGFNALAHCVVNVALREPNPMLVPWALEAITKLAQGLPKIADEPRNLQARTRVLYGSCLAGAVIGMGVTTLHHKLCHVLGGAFGTPHAQTHALLLPHTVAFNAPAVEGNTQRVAEALGVDDAAVSLQALGRSVGVVSNLRELGLREEDLDEVARLATAAPVNNPRQVSFENLRQLLHNVFTGEIAPVGAS